METPKIMMMKDRRFEMIPVDKIKVINSRLRDEDQFQMNVQSIESVGQQKPIRVNDKYLEKSGAYELICGEGRLIAHQRLKKPFILAEVVTCTRKEAYLQSLIENLARSRVDTMVFARELKRLHDQGWDHAKIARIACKTPEYIRLYIGLVEKGEDRLIKGVEQGIFPITFAVNVAQADDANIQNVLMDAFDQGIVNCQNFGRARAIINARFDRRDRQREGNTATADYSVAALTTDIVDTTRAKDSYIRQVKEKENRLFLLLDALGSLWSDPELLDLLRAESLANRPALTGKYNYQIPA